VREFVGETLSGAEHEELVDDAQVAVSEVVTNAVVHAATPIDVTVSIGPEAVRVSVRDRGRHFPRAREYADTAATGRGMRLVDQLVSAWGVEADAAGKTVWFDLPVQRSDPGRSAPNGGGQRQPVDAEAPRRVGRTERSSGTSVSAAEATDEVEVLLLGVPVLLYRAWRQHAESLLREYFLVRLDGGPEEEAVQVHAAASDALALFDEAIPAPAEPGDDPGAALAAATAPGSTAPVVRIRVQRSSRAHVKTLNDALEAAVRLAEEGRFLTPPTQPELRLLRRWLCDQVERQCSGSTPEPWVLPDPSATTGRQVGNLGDATGVTDDPGAVIAADSSGRVVAASRAAAVDLLGYDAVEMLLGKRLVSLIPARFRQAHLAGFTVHLLTGRPTLIDQPVTVPVLRCDDSETMVRLTIRIHQADDGRSLFVAELAPTSARVV
jgi:hypothetical protein